MAAHGAGRGDDHCRTLADTLRQSRRGPDVAVQLLPIYALWAGAAIAEIFSIGGASTAAIARSVIRLRRDTGGRYHDQISSPHLFHGRRAHDRTDVCLLDG